ncbi:MAG TPA: ABC transporter ATP-binding protein [Gaiellaceae bacterium]
MATIHVEIGTPLRSFRLELALELGSGTTALAGPSGAGKTTTLRAIAGLFSPERGRIEADGQAWFDSSDGTDLPPERRSVGLVFQDYALFPHLTVADNVAYGGRARVQELLERLGISQLARARPGELSGGERQRVAIARALAREPKLLLLDEPLAALDVSTRARVRGELRELLRQLALPTLVVAHDFADAAALGERIVVLDRGRIVQEGTAAELIAQPAGPFVAEFAGGNLLEARAEAAPGGLTRVTLSDGTTMLSVDPGDGPVGVVVYPWEIALGRELPADSTQNHVRAPIDSLVPVANRVRVRVGPLIAEVTADSAERLGLRQGETVVASFKATGTRLVPLG